MKYFILLTTTLALCFPALAEEAPFAKVIREACDAAAEKYEYNGVKIGMTEEELAALGSEPAKENVPASGMSSVLVKDKTMIFWKTPEAPEDKIYGVNYAIGALKPFSKEDGTSFAQSLIDKYGEPTINTTGASYLDVGYPKMIYGPQKDVKKEKFQPIKDCLSKTRDLDPYEKRAVEDIGSSKFLRAYEALQTSCPDLMEQYHDYMVYALQPVIEIYTSKVNFRIDMSCPAHEKFK